ncbi:DUF397 domain-containing protein [Streptomyces sp. NPDC088752]|uniref:DUF397 domain-containing protein n=1 Tax=Streptomyces sp. NPDC088752 TaxID=3154963 RepID=UPI00342CEB8B
MERKEFTGWHKSSRSGVGENCVEQGIDATGGLVGVGDTKQDGAGPVLAFASDAWTAFVGDVKATTV